MSDRYERLLRTFFKDETKRLNQHLPKVTKSLSELLSESEPSVETIGGSQIIMKKSDLEEMAKIVPKDYQDKLRLPIIVLRRIELGRGAFSVMGDNVEKFTVKHILGLTKLSFDDLDKENEDFFVYRPQVQELLRKFKSLIVIAFGAPQDMGL
jgi:uncharacterized protein (UPF0216 family)